MSSSPSIALFFVKLSVGLKEWMNKGKKAHNLPLHGPLTQDNLCAFYTEKKNDAVYPVFCSFPTWDPFVFIGTFGFGEPVLKLYSRRNEEMIKVDKRDVKRETC